MKNFDEQQDNLDAQEFMEALYPEPGWTIEEVEKLEASIRKELINGRPSTEIE